MAAGAVYAAVAAGRSPPAAGFHRQHPQGRQRAGSTRHINLDKSHKYVLVKVAWRAKRLGGWIQERAHRIVLWAFHGPPPAYLLKPVAMHLCHNRGCCNPQHLVWGEDRENRRKKAVADVAARRRLEQQGRYLR